MSCILAFVFLFCIIPLSYSRHVEFYRKDYTYIQEYDAFFKVHWDASVSAWNTAFLACVDEGATLFYPQTQNEWVLVKNLTNRMTEVPNVTKIFVGIHDEFNLGELITVDGLSTPYPLPTEGIPPAHGSNCITMDIDTGKFNVGSCLRTLNAHLPFVCKKVPDYLKESCPTIDHGYKLMKTLNKCYKINKEPKTWQEAMKTCFTEGGILAVFENSVQAEEIRKYLKDSETYFVGVKKLLPRDEFYTVKGKKFSDMYQNPYKSNPNPDNDGQYQYYNGQNPYYNSQTPDENGYYPNEHGQYPDENGQYPEYIPPRINVECGAVRNRNNIQLNTETHDCDSPLPFICQMEVRMEV